MLAMVLRYVLRVNKIHPHKSGGLRSEERFAAPSSYEM
jgi:hypothetical protein